jgi:hypothetical protein
MMNHIPAPRHKTHEAVECHLALCAARLEDCALSPVVARNVPDIFAMSELETVPF